MVNLLATARWESLSSLADAVVSPDDLPEHGWLPALVPGTAAELLRNQGKPLSDSESDLDGLDWWWRTTVDTHTCLAGWLLTAEGLATLADVWVAGTHVLHSENMFRSHTVVLTELPRTALVVIRCKATLSVVKAPHPRPRWKSSLVTRQGWRWLRTSLLGRVPAWAGSAAPIGPWRAMSLQAVDHPLPIDHQLSARIDGEDGIVTLEAKFVAPALPRLARVQVGETVVDAELAHTGTLRTQVRVPNVQPWWPHTHGEPHHYSVSVIFDEDTIRLPDIGFRSIVADRSNGGFDLRINGVPIFIRGACWMPVDPVTLRATPEELRASIELARDAGCNMLRVVGGTIYESDIFYDICTEVGMLVWQDFMLATLDPPETKEFTAELTAEATQIMKRLSGQPCITVLSGGSEIAQQPAFSGIPYERSTTTATDELLSSLLQQYVPDLPYISSTPTGGAMPTDVSPGVAHYYGVGAYLRPLSDVRTARVRFAAECLALSIPQEPPEVQRWFGTAHVAGHHPAWKAGVPRDRDASWDFEDVRDHYVARIFDVDPMLVRIQDPERYLDLGRAVACVLMTEAFTQWRRPASGCAGALVWTMRDLVPGAGWGLTDSGGEPKAPWYALRTVLAPVAVLVSNDGLDGIRLTACNDTATPIEAKLEVRVWSVAGIPLESVSKDILVPAQEALELPLDEIVGHFTDAGYAYRFGPRVRDALQVRLIGKDGDVLVEHAALLGSHIRPAQHGVLQAATRRGRSEWNIDITATQLAQWVSITCAGYRPAESWFHLAPGTSRRVRLDPVKGNSDLPVAYVRALNVPETLASYSSHASGRDQEGRPWE